MRRTHRWLCRLAPIVVLLLTPLALAAQAGEVPEDATDHPMISPYEGSVMHAYEHLDYDRIEVPYRTEDDEVEMKPVEGEVTRILYATSEDEDLSSFQVHRNYQMALQDAGFEIVDECLDEHDGCYDYYVDGPGFEGLKNLLVSHDKYYFLARKPGGEGDVYVTAHTMVPEWYDEIKDRPNTILQIVEEKPMATGKVNASLDADAMAEDLEEAGTVRIYGIHFDTDEATIEPASEPTLAEIAGLLEARPDLELAVVGHTDTEGGFEHNMELSARRAEAVVERLTGEHGVAADRLQAHGMGWLAPVATNATEEGRAQNRRVELVELP